MTAAAILEQEGKYIPEFAEVGAVDDQAASTLRLDQTSPRENAQMRRHRIVWNGHLPSDLAGRQPFGLVLNKQAEHVETCSLCEGREGQDCFFSVHDARLEDTWKCHKHMTATLHVVQRIAKSQ